MNATIREDIGRGVVLVRINRAEVRNAINQDVREQLARHFRSVSVDPDVRAVVLTSVGNTFAAGADLMDLAELSPVDHILQANHRLWQAIADCPQPVIAAVRGYAVGGGCELAMHADIIVAGESARFGQPEVRLGLMPGAGGTQRLTRAVGKYQAMKMVLLGEPVPAAEAYRMGLISEVVADDKVHERALEMAAQLAERPYLAVRQIKEVLLAGADASLAAALTLERKAFQVLLSTNDQKEGTRAFLEKRPPNFIGR